MKTIIISDIKRNNESIIPYGLNLAKYLESEVDIVHVIDPRIQHGVSGSVADSQSIAPGGTLSHDKILQREKKLTENTLNRILSKEASRLNYPLKINTIIEENSLESKLKELINENPSNLIIASLETDGYFFKTHDDLLSTLKNLDAISILVPPDLKFKIYENVLITTDFSGKDFEVYTGIFLFLNRFETRVTAIDLKENKYADWKMRSQGWLKSARDLMPELQVTTNVIDRTKNQDSMLDYVRKNDPDLIVIFKPRKNFIKELVQKTPEQKILEYAGKPVLLYPG
jgi:nucleotide-binding universal stress UspA family protein